MNTDPLAFPRRCERCLGPLTGRQSFPFADEMIRGDRRSEDAAVEAQPRLGGESRDFVP